MKCERCSTDEDATYRVYTDAMEMKVCAACAAEAQKLGIASEALAFVKEKKNEVKSNVNDKTSALSHTI